jgi:hypothetical protein
MQLPWAEIPTGWRVDVGRKAEPGSYYISFADKLSEDLNTIPEI